MRRVLLFLAVCAAGCTDSAVPRAAENGPMTTPVLPEPGALVGQWRLDVAAGRTCSLRLLREDRPLEAGSLAAPMLGVEGDCPEVPSLAGWRPAPLGLELTDAAGFAVLSFEQVAPQEYLSSASGARLTRR